MVENIRLSLKGILSHKMRSFLTMLGIIIGIAAIIAIVSTIQGTNEQIQKNLIGSGQNNIEVRLCEGDWEYDYSAGIPAGVSVLSEKTKQALSGVSHVRSVSFYRWRRDYEGIYHVNESLSGAKLYGIDENYFYTTGKTCRAGRLIEASDRKDFCKVCVLDENSARSLFPGENPVGKTIEIKQEPFTVIGLVAEKQEFEPSITTIEEYYTYAQDESGSVYICDSVWPLVYQYDEPESVVLMADGTDSLTSVGKEAEKILNEAANFAAESTLSYKAKDLIEQAREIQQLSQSTNTMLLWIAGISLLVGGIGVMNIMLVSVTERTSEIGLKKAIGAPKKAIMMQFLTEAVVLTSAGGLFGVISGIILAEVISHMNGTPVAISVPASLFAVLFSMIIGIIFGILPSYKAANLDPIEALRHE